ncbi:MAG: glycosyltransferase involved in cell wall biosynthesis [Ulvibacter sp.]|jgi:glycosyltransferase involved in cell wall biosynthesis
MKILLVGEYSRLHNTLKEGLNTFGHEVTLVGDGDGFKNFPVDVSIKAVFVQLPVLKWITLFFYKVFNLDLTELERGLRFFQQLKRLKNYDVVQLINEKPIKTIPFFERYLLKRLFQQNSKIFLLSCGIDLISLEFMLEKGFRYSLMDPYHENPDLKTDYKYIQDYKSKSHRETHDLVFENINGVIATDFDYVLPLLNHKQFLGLVPNPINIDHIDFRPLAVENTVVIFLGINTWTYHKKGISFFEKALKIIEDTYSEKVKIIRVESIPYKQYLRLYEEAHIILDQVYAYDQGYNALEAMAAGKVVFTGAEKEFLEHYGLEDDEVCINALPDVNAIVMKLSMLIENPKQIEEIGNKARKFIAEEHDYKKIASLYLERWQQ